MLRDLHRTILVSAAAFAFFTCGNAPRAYVPRSGDIIFHTSRSSQSVAVQRATSSRYSHMGVVFVRSGEPFVYEAVQPVKLTPLAAWTGRGVNGRFVVKRLRDADRLLTPATLRKLESEGRKFNGKSYDLYFEWSDDRIYCSELVWKMYKRALGIEVGSLQRLNSFDLSHPAVKKRMRERWPNGPPGRELVISPSAMFESDQLLTVYYGFESRRRLQFPDAPPPAPGTGHYLYPAGTVSRASPLQSRQPGFG